MTPVTIALAQDSFRKLVPIAELAADIFYARLFETAPELRRLFPKNMDEQKVKLVQMLVAAVNGLDRFHEILPAVQALGRRHAEYGVEPEHYGTVGLALLHTLRTGLAEEFTAEVEAAWAEVFGLFAGAMIAAPEEEEA